MALPGIPHHITQRGNRRERTFFEDRDYALYLDQPSVAAQGGYTKKCFCRFLAVEAKQCRFAG